MDQSEDAALDKLLREHLSERLNGQLGKARARFEQEMFAKSASVVPARHRVWKWRAAVIGAMAMAAAVILLIAGNQFLARGVKPPGHTATNVAAGPVLPKADGPRAQVRRVWVQTIEDEGVVTLSDNTPARKLRCRRTERIESYDPERQRTVQVTVPSEHVMLARLDKY
jgi:hypothetical protein